MRRAKIVATIGPASDSPELLDRLLEAGMDVARLNFSHGTQADQERRIARLRQAAGRRGRTLTLLQDLQGPKIRTGPLAGGGPVQLVAGQRLTITTRPVEGSAEVVSTGYAGLPRDVKPGDRVLVSDGLIELRALSTTEDAVLAGVVTGGELRERQGINLPRGGGSSSALTEKDEADLEFGLAQGVDWIALSFVRRAEDVLAVKERIAGAGRSTPVMAKIEKPEALEHIPAILEAADGIMVARGDLGVELPPAEVPVVQKQLIAACNSAGKPVVTATQMLESMIVNPRPTRAEASDVANAIMDGTDAVMLSGETAVGKYPAQAVGTMAQIAEVVEAEGRDWIRAPQLTWDVARHSSVAEAISAAAVAVERVLQVEGIVAYTRSGNTARLVSRLRPRARVFGFTPDEATARRINLLWGVTPVLCGPIPDLAGLERAACGTLLAQGALKSGDEVVLTGAHPLLEAAETNLVKVVRL
ncbi:MAG TPA: pyruvate kinase [Chloroflexota bacterium]|nr:pyruvate kinase [Chloroflexota bacterium]